MTKRTLFGLAVMLGLVFAAVSGTVVHPQQANAAAAAPQCNAEMNGGGTEVACTIIVENYIAVGGGLSSTTPSTLTMTRCVGASGPLWTLTCTPTVTVLTAPVTSVQQCNGSGSGSGGTVICTVTITNHFEGSIPTLSPATIYQCVGSVITGTGAPGLCSPANTAGVSSVAEATVGQCNGSGNGGTSVGFTCTVTTNSTTSTAMPINVDQCNGSANGGGALTICTVSVLNLLVPPANTPTAPANTPTASANTPTAPANTPTAPANTPTAPANTPTATETPPASVTPPLVTPPAQFPPVTPPVSPPEVTPPATPTSGLPHTTPQAQTPPSMTPAAPSSTPLPPNTGDSVIGTTVANSSQGSLAMLGLLVASFGLIGLALSKRRSDDTLD